MLDEQNNNLQPVDGSEETTSDNSENQSIETNGNQIAENNQEESTQDVGLIEENVQEEIYYVDHAYDREENNSSDGSLARQTFDSDKV